VERLLRLGELSTYTTLQRIVGSTKNLHSDGDGVLLVISEVGHGESAAREARLRTSHLDAAGLIVPAESEVMDGPLRVLGIVDPDPFQLKGIRGLNITLREVNELRSHYSVTPALALYSYSTPEAAVKSLKAPLGSAVPM